MLKRLVSLGRPCSLLYVVLLVVGYYMRVYLGLGLGHRWTFKDRDGSIFHTFWHGLAFRKIPRVVIWFLVFITHPRDWTDTPSTMGIIYSTTFGEGQDL